MKHRLPYQKPSSYYAVNTFHLGSKTDQFMLYEAKAAICFEITTKHINTV